jgi:hypothetical protein
MKSMPLWIALAAVAPLAGCVSGDHSSDTPDAAVHDHHTIDYIEFTVSDMAQAKQFYADAFGWSFNDYGPEYAGICKAEGGEVGGLRLDAEVRPGGPLVVLYSDDLEASESAVVAAGGRITHAIFAFPGGRRFQFADPAGNELAVYAAD